MEDIELIIKINEEEYNIIKKSNVPMTWAEHLIAKGTVLPKGHGRLIDEKEIIEEIVAEEIDGIYYDVIYAHSIYDAETIIEADEVTI